MVTSVERFILYSFWEFCSQANKKIDNKPLSLAVSKAEFITLIKNANITIKTERAVYRNLETLQEKKLVMYKDKSLRLTRRGQNVIKKINTELMPYLNIKDILKTESLLKHARKAQTVLSFKED